MRGRPRRPVESRIADGSYYRPSRHGVVSDDEPSESKPPICPAYLKGDERKIWDELIALLANVVRERDGPVLADLCTWRAEYKRIRAKMRQTKPGMRGYNQLVSAAKMCADAADKIASRFGLTPSDRAKLRAEQVGPVKPKVATRKPTKLDKQGGPK